MAELSAPGHIGRLKLRNRLVMTAMVTALASEEGYVSDTLLNFLEERARGGVGLMVWEASLVDSKEVTWVNQLRIDDDRFVPGFRRAVQRFGQLGVPCAIQLNHLARAIIQAKVRDRLAAMQGFVNNLPRSDIQEMVEQFVRAARRARDAGFAAVELHGAHGCTLSEFLSRGVNFRTDEYGGSIRKRAGLLLEVLARIKEALGADYPVLIRLNAADHIPDGNTLDDAVEIGKLLKEYGADAIDLSRGFEFLDANPTISPMLFPPGVLIDSSRRMKQEVGLPIIVANRIQDPALMEKVVREGYADFVGLGRGLIADPALPAKILSGRPDAVRRCIACNSCINATEHGQPLLCLVNAEVGREGRYSMAPCSRPKRVMVVGGGPAGMEAARIAAIRGHQVDLYEKTPWLGGQFRLAYVPPGKEEFRNFPDWLERELTKLSVRIHLNTAVTPELIAAKKPDAVVVAAGARPIYRRYPGAGAQNAVLSFDILSGDVKPKGRVVVLGGGLIGLETAELIARQGLPVSVVSRRTRLGENMVRTVRIQVMEKLDKYGVKIYREAQVVEVTESSVVITQVDNTGELTTLTLPQETVVVAGGMEPAGNLAEQVNGLVDEVYEIGDHVSPWTAVEAVREGWFVGLAI